MVEIIEQALKRKGFSAAAASKMAVGNPSLIKNIRNGQGRVSFDHLQKLALVLDLECRFGQIGGNAPLPPRLCARLHLPDGATEADALAAIDLLSHSGHRAMRIAAVLKAALPAIETQTRAMAQALGDIQAALGGDKGSDADGG